MTARNMVGGLIYGDSAEIFAALSRASMVIEAEVIERPFPRGPETVQRWEILPGWTSGDVDTAVSILRRDERDRTREQIAKVVLAAAREVQDAAQVDVTRYTSERDGAQVVEIAFEGHLRVVVGDQTVFDEDTESRVRPCADCGVQVTIHRDSDAAAATELRCEDCEVPTCRYCGQVHRQVPDDLCDVALAEYRAAEKFGTDMGLTP